MALTLVLALLENLSTNGPPWLTSAFAFGKYAGIVATGVKLWLLNRRLKPYVMRFNPADWKCVNGRHRLEIPKRKHKRGKSPDITFEMVTDDGFEAALVDEHVLSNGDVMIMIDSQPLPGRITIRQ